MKATLHWVSAAHAIDEQVRLYDRLFAVENPGAGDTDFLTQLNPRSLEVRNGCKLEPSLAAAAPGSRSPLHWAASSDHVPVPVIDVMLNKGAVIEAPGSVIRGGTPLAHAAALGQWKAAHRLIERGAQFTLW